MILQTELQVVLFNATKRNKLAASGQACINKQATKCFGYTLGGVSSMAVQIGCILKNRLFRVYFIKM